MKNRKWFTKVEGTPIKRIVVAIIILLIVNLRYCYSQTELSLIDTLKPVINNFALNERVSLECDRDFYLVGETVYFSCMTYEPILKAKLAMSQIVYVEFFTDENKVIGQVKIRLKQGVGDSYFELPKKISTGIYYIRAYTNYMKNFGSEVFYMQSFSVFNPFEKKSQIENVDLSSSLKKIALAVEGGNLVYNAINKVACFSSDMSNNPVTAKGKVVDQNGSIVSIFNTNKQGLGFFTFMPKPNITYRIEMVAKGDMVQQNLVTANRSICLSEINQRGDTLYFKTNNYEFTNYPLVLKVVKDFAMINLLELDIADSVFQIPVSLVPYGLVQFQLVDATKKVLAARSIMVQSDIESILKMSTNLSAVKCRDTISLSLESNADRLVSISVSMVDSNYISAINPMANNANNSGEFYGLLDNMKIPFNTIANDSIWSKDLPLFQTNESLAASQSSNLNVKNPFFLPEIQSDIISGVLLQNENYPIAGATICQTFVDSVAQFSTFKTKEDGSFYFYSNQSDGIGDLILFQNEELDGRIEYQDEFFIDFMPVAKEKINLSCFNKETLNKQFLNLQINDSYSDEFRKGYDCKENTLAFYGTPDRIFMIKDFIALLTLEEFLFEVVPWVYPYRKDKKSEIRIFFKGTDKEIGENPLFLLDGIPVKDQESLLNLKCKDLRSVSVIYNKYFFQNCYFDGILDIKTIKADGRLVDLPSSCQRHTFFGIKQSVKSSAKFETVKSPLPYFKNQLFWEPAITLLEDTPLSVSFLAPDNPGLFLVKSTVFNPDGSKKSFYSSFEVIENK